MKAAAIAPGKSRRRRTSPEIWERRNRLERFCFMGTLAISNFGLPIDRRETRRRGKGVGVARPCASRTLADSVWEGIAPSRWAAWLERRNHRPRIDSQLQRSIESSSSPKQLLGRDQYSPFLLRRRCAFGIQPSRFQNGKDDTPFACAFRKINKTQGLRYASIGENVFLIRPAPALGHRNRVCCFVDRRASRWAGSRSRNPACPGTIRFLALSRLNQPARSTSGNSCRRPDFGGHSMENVLLRAPSGEQSPSTAHTVIALPVGCVICPSGKNSPLAAYPVSSWNSLFAATSASSSSPYSPLGMDHAPSSLFFQNGPPG